MPLVPPEQLAQLDWFTLTSGARIAEVPNADPESSTTILVVEAPPGSVIPVHRHRTDYCEVILKGEQIIGRTRYSAGHYRMVSAGRAYGPLVAGEEGCTVLVVYATADWRPEYVSNKAEQVGETQERGEP